MAYRTLFEDEPGTAAIGEIRLAINQSQPLGGKRFLAQIEAATGKQRAPRPRGRPASAPSGAGGFDGEQGELEI